MPRLALRQTNHGATGKKLSRSDHGRVAYVRSDGGTTASPDGIVRKATVLRLELEPSDSPA
jgi:hypothetical protein